MRWTALVAVVLIGATAGPVQARRSDESCSVNAAIPAPPEERPHYTIDVHVLQGLKVATGALRATFTAPTGGTDRLVFRLWPNGPVYARAGAHLSISRVREHNRPLPVSHPNATTLVVARPVAAGETAIVAMNWRLTLPTEIGLRLKGGGRAVRLASFFPVLAWDGSGWALDPPTTRSFGEAWTTPIADFDVRVLSPARLSVVASGEQVAKNRWQARAVRDFGLALGRFRIARGIAHVPGPVRVTAAVERTVGARRPGLYVDRAIDSLERYSQLYASYPWPSYTTVAMGDLSDPGGGYEYPTLVYLPASGNGGVPHETAHQWFYSLVGNDQGRDPWLDEGLATWAEVALNGAPPFSDATIPPEVADRIGEPMTFWDRFSDADYFLGVYLQSYRALQSFGSRDRVECALRLYVARNAYRIARPRDLLAALTQFFPNAQSVLEGYGARF